MGPRVGARCLPMAMVAAAAPLVVAGLLSAPTEAYAQTECVVTATHSGFWDRVEVTCDTSERPRAAAVKSEVLRTCPLLAGDRVKVEYENDDRAGQPVVTAVTTRGGAGTNAGDWCGRAIPPARLTGPCMIERDPPREKREEVAGAIWVTKSRNTVFRNVDDNRISVAPGGCTPVALEPGVHRIYVTEEISRSTWMQCANDPERLCQETEYETNRYEGGIYVDARAEPVETVTDVSPFVRGWSGGGETAPAPALAAPWVTTNRINMTGTGIGVPWVATNAIKMTGTGNRRAVGHHEYDQDDRHGWNDVREPLDLSMRELPMSRTTWAVALLIALTTGAADALRAQQADTVLVWDVPVELRTLSPEVARVFVECPMAYVSESGVEDALGVFRSEEVAVTPTRLGGYVSDRIQVAVTTSDLLGPPRGPPLGGYLIHCELFLVGPDGTSLRPRNPGDSNLPPGTPGLGLHDQPV